MENSYQLWARVQAYLSSKYRRRYYKEGEIFWVSVGMNIGQEQNGKGLNFTRPVLVVKGYNERLFFGLPLSNTKRRGPYYYPITLDGEERAILLSQGSKYDTARIIGHSIYSVSKEELEQIVLAFLKTFHKI